MDLSNDFPYTKIYDAQEIIDKFDKVVNDIELKKNTIDILHENLDEELAKLDTIIKDTKDIKQILQNVEINLQQTLYNTESNIQDSIKNTDINTNKHIQEIISKLEDNIESKIDDIKIPKPSENIELLIFMSSLTGLALGLFLNYLSNKK